MGNLNAEQIIKALECCAECDYCVNCDVEDYCKGMDNLIKNALALIKELTEENERLTMENEKLDKICEEWSEDWEDNQKKWETAYEKLEGEIVADIVRDMQERFYELMGTEFASCGYCNAEGYWSVKEVKACIDKIAKEMLEGKNDG